MFLLKVRRARMLKDKENKFIAQAFGNSDLEVIKDVSVHAAVNEEGGYLNMRTDLQGIFWYLQMSLKWNWSGQMLHAEKGFLSMNVSLNILKKVLKLNFQNTRKIYWKWKQ